MATEETYARKSSEICRLCLKQDGDMASIFQTVDAEDGDFSLAQRISTIARVQVHQGDGLPALICHTCRHQVEKSYNFRLLVEISDRTLRNCLETEQSQTGEDQVKIKQEIFAESVESDGEENVGLEHFLLQNNLSDSEIDPPPINVILVQSNDRTHVLNICGIDNAQESERFKQIANVKRESPSVDVPEVYEQNDNANLDDFAGIQEFLSPEKIYVQSLEPQIQRVYTCSECNKLFLTDDELNNHISAAHEGDGEDAHKYGTEIHCQLCFEVFNSLADLKNHITEHFDEGRGLDNFKSDGDNKILPDDEVDTISTVVDEDCQYILQVSKNDESCSEMVVTQDKRYNDITEDAEDNEFIEISSNNDSTNGWTENRQKRENLDLELNIGVDNDMDYKSDVYYCVNAYLSDDGTKVRSTGNFPCTQCDKTFIQKHEHTLHLRRHMGIKPFKCNLCDKAFITNALRKEHERSHTGDTAFVCVVCGKGFVKKSELKYHEGIHTDTPSTCNVCHKQFTNIQSFKMHAKRHILGSRYNCETCGKSYFTNSELARHVQMHSGKREYPCSMCQTSFLSRPELNRHLKYHIGEKKFRCKICFKSYYESGHLKIHERVHTGEKPFACTVCNKAFVTKPKLVRHEKIHLKEKTINSAVNDEQQKTESIEAETIL